MTFFQWLLPATLGNISGGVFIVAFSTSARVGRHLVSYLTYSIVFVAVIIGRHNCSPKTPSASGQVQESFSRQRAVFLTRDQKD